MAEPHPRAGTPRMNTKRRTRRPARALLLTSALIAIIFSGLFLARSASAATAAPSAAATSGSLAAPAAATATAEKADPATGTQLTAILAPTALDSGVCNVPGVGDIGGLLGLCKSGSGVVGDLNNICTSGAPSPELATAGINSMITTPGGTSTSGKTLYDNYAMAGLYWAQSGLTCSQMTSQIGNNVAGMVFDMAKSLDRVTITVYQSAAGANILSWLGNSVDRLITALGNAIYFPFLAPMVIIGALWLAWQGLVRKRATKTFEGTIWMVVACAAAIWLIGRPADFTNVGTTVSNGVTSVLNTAFAKLPATAGSDCLPVAANDPESVSASYAFTSGNGLVDQNANELWTVLVCKPWLDGEFGTTQYATSASQPQTLVNQYGRQLLWAQAVATNEQPTVALDDSKQAVYNGIAQQLQQTNPSVYSLFQGDQWTTRLEIGFEALFAAVAAGLLVLLIALTLIMLKLGFLLLLVAGPFFLIVGIHPGFGRVIAIRWFEMLVGVLMKQVAVALTLSVLLYCYSLIMGTTDQVLPWALKIMMIALVTVTVVIYRKPFQHLFSSVGYGMIGADERAQVTLRESTFGFRRVTAGAAGAAGAVSPAAAAARASRWARRGPGESATAADQAARSGAAAASGASVPEGTAAGAGADSRVSARQWPGAGSGRTGRRAAPPLPLPSHGAPPVNTGPASAGWARGSGTGTGTGSGARGGPSPAQAPSREPAPAPVRQGPAPSPARHAPPPPARPGPAPAPARQASPPAPVRQGFPSAPARQGPSPARPASGSGWPGAVSRPRSESSNGTNGTAAPPPAAAPFWARSRRRSK
jgi:TrbL/VirB6 plasmid conjugal transfer protein